MILRPANWARSQGSIVIRDAEGRYLGESRHDAHPVGVGAAVELASAIVDAINNPPQRLPETATIRDQFAMVALQGMIPRIDPNMDKGLMWARAVAAYRMADQMMKARQP